MTITALGVMGTRSQGASTGTCVITCATAGASVGDLVVVVVARDNASTTDGVTNEISACVDNAGNLYRKLGEYCNGQGGAGAGATVALWMTTATYAIAITTGTITATIAGNPPAAAGAYKYSTSPGYVAIPATSIANLATDGAALGSLSIVGIPWGNYLFLRGSAIEIDTLTGAASAGWTAFANTSVSTGAMSAWGEHRIATDNSATSAPTISGAGPPDSASVMIALREDWISTALFRTSPI